MRKIMSICLMLMCQLALMGQTGLGSDPNYNPTNPEDPQTPEKKYTLSTEVSPKHSGSTNLSSTKKYTEGTKISLTANGNTGYKFVNWLQGDSVVSTSSSFSYTMPAKNVTLTAVFEYNPNSPADPDSLGLNYDLRIVASPKNGGTFNINNTKVQEAHTISLYAYPNTGYLFKGWQMGDSILSTVSPYTHTMGNKDTTITGLFEYNPSNPSYPGKNSWNEEFGEVVVDDFTAGSLYNAINQVTGGDNSSVTMITVSGRMSSNDFSIANNFSNCTMVDLKRTYGYTDVPDYAYDYNTALTSIILPASIENIGYRAFYQASNLADVTCYAITPPKLGKKVFEGIAEGAVLHVLSSSIPLYQESEGWKDFTILPLIEEVQALEVNLPVGSEDGRYKNMTLELVNVESGQKQKYVISDRVTYTFYGLLKNSMFNVYVRNNMGVILGQIENILIEDKDISVSFESLLQTQDVTLKVQTPDGTDVTSQTQIRWFDSADNYLVQGNEILSQLGGTNVRYHITLPQELGMQYLMPADSTYTIQEEGNTLVCTLHPLEEVTISGRVKDVTTGSALSDAVVSISQKLNGLYSKSFTVRTDKNGEFTAKVFNDQSSITISASDYLNHTLEFANFNDTIFVGEVSLKGITGAIITTNLTYTTSVVEGETAEIQEWYADYANVAYEIYNETQQRAITLFKVQYPSIILLEEVAEGDVLTLTASSRTNAFVPVKATTTIDEQNRAKTTFDIVELGAIRANFTSTDNSSVVGLLYDGKGQLVEKYIYGSATLSITNLVDGEYTLVSMTNSSLFNSILNLSQFVASGLKEGVDYVQNTVAVKTGVIAIVSNEMIPVLDERKLYYTGDNTLFSVNKTSIVAGNYLTLKGKIDFKSEYAPNVSNVSMVVDIPESCSFVENSVMLGRENVGNYILDGHRLTIPLADKYTEQVRFCIIPTDGGNFAPSAFAQFTLDGNEVLQPIGNANFTVKDLTISVPSTVAKTSIPISGIALGNSTVEVYDNDIKIGETTSLANGAWYATCELNDPYNLSTHSIYAKVITKQGLVLQSETHECMYDRYAIEALKVTMINVAHTARSLNPCEFVTVFDFKNPEKPIPAYWYWPNYPKFTFLIELSNNDTTVVSDVTLHVKTTNGNYTPLKASYDGEKNLWVASGNFGSWTDYDIPEGVSVDFEAKTERLIDYEQIQNLYQSNMLRANLDSIDVVFSDFVKITDKYYAGQIDADKYEQLKANYYNSLDIDKVEEDSLLLTYLSSLSYEQLIGFTDSLLSDSASTKIEILDYYSAKKDLNSSQVLDFSVDGSDFSYVKNECSHLNPVDLLLDGFMQIPMTNGDTIYTKSTETSLEVVDFTSNQYLKHSITENRDYSAKNTRDALDMYNNALNKLEEYNTDLVKFSERLSDIGAEIENWFEIEYTKKMSKAKALRMSSKRIVDEYIIEGIEGGTETAKHYELEAVKIEQDAAKLKKWMSDVKVISKNVLGDIVGLLSDISSLHHDITRWMTLDNEIHNMLPCNGDSVYAEELAKEVRYYGTMVCTADVLALGGSCVSIGVTVASLAGIPLSGGFSSIPAGAGIAMAVVSVGAAYALDWAADMQYNRLSKEVNELNCSDDDKCHRCGKNPCECKDKCPKCGHKPCICDNTCQKCGHNPCICSKYCPKCGKRFCLGHFWPRSGSIHDPSGFVYEGVSSNRINGVKATAYYKETVEDMYGDLHENIVLWDAEQYAQENPLFTDENGMYRWDVPQGLWQVKFEKEGYETTYSEWLPVPPPQLEVNIAMTQNKQPEVKMARAYEDGIEVEFDKYMQLDGLTTENIFVTKNGETAAGTVTLLNEEQAYEDNPVTYASKVRFIPETSFLTTDEVTLTVSRKVKSYAGVPMEADYTQTFDIEKEVKGLVADSVVKVEYGGEKTIVVSAFPYDAAIGKTLIVKSSSSMITTVDSDTLVLDENGQATVTVTGELPGVSMLTFTLADVDVSSMSTVEVTSQEELITARPVASRVSGTAVYRNTEITLSCGTKDAVIYYTLDGSCPCDEATRLVYEGPIVVTDDNMVIKAMAVAEDMYESDVVEFNYSLKKTVLGMSLKEGWNWVSHNVETAIAGSELQQNAMRIVGQTKELVNDPSYGLVGNLDYLSPVESYKVHVSKNTDYTLTGYEFNASTPICLYSGWNWLGYPVNQVMSVGEAFANATPMEGDYIVGQDGFALYNDGAWVGTLLILSPGRGYMYQSKSDNEFAYNTAIVSKAKALYSRGVVNQTPWTADKHKYPNIMCIIAELYVNGHVADAGQYSVGAFCGTECRGVGKYVNGKLMMTVYGNGNENITFLAVDNETEEVYNIVEEVKFTETLLGSMERSYALNVSDATGIQYAKTGWNVQVDGERVYLELNGKPFDHVSLTDVSGNKVLAVDNVTENMVVDMGALPDGTYIVTATQGDSMYYKKILKAGR